MIPARKPVLQKAPQIQKIRRYTYADYYSWDDDKRWELIDGIAYAMAPAPSPSHQSISGNIFGQIWQFLCGKKCRLFHAPLDVRLNADTKDDTVVQPDIVIICDESKINDRGCAGAPDMVVEILSPSSVEHDMVRKYELYLKYGVREYWIVDPKTETVAVHILAGGTYVKQDYNKTDIAPVNVVEGCFVDFGKVF